MLVIGKLKYIKSVGVDTETQNLLCPLLNRKYCDIVYAICDIPCPVTDYDVLL